MPTWRLRVSGVPRPVPSQHSARTVITHHRLCLPSLPRAAYAEPSVSPAQCRCSISLCMMKES